MQQIAGLTDYEGQVIKENKVLIGELYICPERDKL